MNTFLALFLAALAWFIFILIVFGWFVGARRFSRPRNIFNFSPGLRARLLNVFFARSTRVFAYERTKSMIYIIPIYIFKDSRLPGSMKMTSFQTVNSRVKFVENHIGFTRIELNALLSALGYTDLFPVDTV